MTALLPTDLKIILLKKAKDSPATFWIIAINVIFFLIAKVVTIFYPPFINVLAFKPSDIIQGGRWWTLFTSMFIHAGMFHLLANMVSLMYLGSFAEKLIKSKRLLGVYLISGIFGSILCTLLSKPNISGVGASGAIFGIAGMLAVLTPKLPVYLLFIPIAIPMWFGVIMLMFILWLLTVLAGLPVGNATHLGGLITGLIYAKYLQYKHPQNSKKVSDHYR